MCLHSVYTHAVCVCVVCVRVCVCVCVVCVCCVCVCVCVYVLHMFGFGLIGSTHFSFQSDFANNEKFITIHVSNKTGGRKVYFPGE